MIECAFFDVKSYDREHFEAFGAGQIRWHYHDFRLAAATAPLAAGMASVCLFVNDRADKDCLERLAANGTKHLALRCAGFNNVDVKLAGQLGLTVTRVPAYSPHAVAEHTVALLLSLNRKIHRAYNRVREHNFSLHGLVGFDLAGKTVGIVGTGRIGRITAEIFRGFQTRVIAFDPCPANDWASQNGIQYTNFYDLLKCSDIISLHLPLTPQTVHLLNAESLAKTRRGVYLINTSRGKLIDTTALLDGLKTGALGGVALDVYEEEEGVFFEDFSDRVLLDDELSRLLTFPNVLVTSHQAFLTHEALKEIARVTTENILRIHRGDPPLEATAL